MTTATKPLPDCCKQRGLFYPDGEKRCDAHATGEERALTAELDRRAKPTLDTHDWPYGPNIDVRARQRAA